MKNWLIVLTFFSLWISTMFNEEVQQALAYGVILSVGVLHGANDLTLIRITSFKKNKSLSFNKVLVYYVLTVLVILAVFFIYPALALFLFLVISSFHFGEQHLREKIKEESLLSKMAYFFYGLTILFMIFNFNINKTLPIFLEVTELPIPKSFFEITFVIAVIGLVITFTSLMLKKQIRVNLVEEIFQLLVLMLVFRVADLLWAFSIYFVLWHSIPSLKDQIEVLHGKAEVKGIKKYLKSSWIYWLSSLIGLVVLYFIFKDDSEFFVSILIYFLAAITFPHVIVMSRLEKVKN